MNAALPPTEFQFTLPRGLPGEHGELYREGTMRLATARDEMTVERDRTAQTQPAYADLLMLSQVITHLGHLSILTPDHLAELFTLDLAYLREFYNRINQSGQPHVPAACPHCQQTFAVALTQAGE